MFQLLDASGPDRLTMQLFSMSEEIMELSAALQSAYVQYSSHYTPTVKGQVVAARFTDMQWYRAAVEEIKTGQAVVRFIDYGNTETVTAANMAELKPEMMQYAIQGVVCALSGVVMAQGWWAFC